MGQPLVHSVQPVDAKGINSEKWNLKGRGDVATLEEDTPAKPQSERDVLLPAASWPEHQSQSSNWSSLQCISSTRGLWGADIHPGKAKQP